VRTKAVVAAIGPTTITMFTLRIMLHPQAPKDQPWFWTITAREQPPSLCNRGNSASREQAMVEFKARWLA